jgi:hypothetical protein
MSSHHRGNAERFLPLILFLTLGEKLPRELVSHICSYITALPLASGNAAPRTRGKKPVSHK